MTVCAHLPFNAFHSAISKKIEGWWRVLRHSNNFSLWPKLIPRPINPDSTIVFTLLLKADSSSDFLLATSTIKVYPTWHWNTRASWHKDESNHLFTCVSFNPLVSSCCGKIVHCTNDRSKALMEAALILQSKIQDDDMLSLQIHCLFALNYSSFLLWLAV